ncbi:hypothetical protein QFC19_001369 [Naganishia cerealis]|uniref:Uncharacterized protein n=1 Tax=Naganishia cerealis TaxID=610337 RepID=A0ACC2WGE9_9TREE|nr:hypothetical protein QFC19_001369 [Naganishia cerealis]
MILPSNTTTTAEAVSAPPAYSAAAAPAPKYTPKKDFNKAFGELQSQYGCERSFLYHYSTPSLTSSLRSNLTVGGGVPVLASKDEKPKARSSSDSSVSSTGSKNSFKQTLKKFMKKSPSSPSSSPETPAKKPTKYVPARIPSPALRVIESGPSLYISGVNGFTYPLYTGSRPPVRASKSSSSSSSADSVDDAKKKKNEKSQATRDNAVRGMVTGIYGFDTTPSAPSPRKSKSPGV